MNFRTLVEHMDAETARSFVRAARHVIDAMLIEGERIEQTRSPQPRDYNTAEIERDAPAGGWLSDAEIHRAAQRMAEAIAAEKWTDGLVFAVQFFARVGGL